MAWRYFSRTMLLHYSKDGICKCFTCGKHYAINSKKMHCGHLVKVFDTGGKTNFSTAFDVKNVFPQCYQCNVIKGGNELKAYYALVGIWGRDAIDELQIKAKMPFKLGKFEMDNFRQEWKEKYDSVKESKGNYWK